MPYDLRKYHVLVLVPALCTRSITYTKLVVAQLETTGLYRNYLYVSATSRQVHTQLAVRETQLDSQGVVRNKHRIQRQQ